MKYPPTKTDTAPGHEPFFFYFYRPLRPLFLLILSLLKAIDIRLKEVTSGANCTDEFSGGMRAKLRFHCVAFTFIDSSACRPAISAILLCTVSGLV